MKVKNLILGSLLLTATFAACTNEELVEINQPQTEKAIALGEDFTINGGFSNEALSRAIYKEESASSIKSLWEPNDSVGGAWYAAYTSTSGGVKYGFNFDGGRFASNHPYARTSTDGNLATAEFGTITNTFAGKYVLYYPYDATVAAVSATIPVKIETAQVMDVANPMAHVNANMFAYDDVEFLVGGNQTSDFELKSVPVLFRLQFKANETTRGLVGQTISKIIIEANTDGLVSQGEIVTVTGAYKDTKVKYQATASKRTNVYTLDVVGNEDNTDYQVTAIGADGITKKAFYIAMLPAVAEELNTMSIKVITTDGEAFVKEITGLSVTDNDYEQILAVEGGFFNYAITLDEVSDEDGQSVYTLAQFNDAWAAALKSNKETEIKLGAPISMESLEMDAVNKSVKITGAQLSVDALTITDCEGLSIDNLVAETVDVDSYGVLNVVKKANIKTLNVAGEMNIGEDGADATVVLGNVTVARNASLAVYGGAYVSSTKENVISTINAGLRSDLTLSKLRITGAGVYSGDVTTSAVHAGTTTIKSTAEVVANGANFSGAVENAGAIISDEARFYALTNSGVIYINDGYVDNTYSVYTFNGSTLNTANGVIVIDAENDAINYGTFTNRGELKGEDGTETLINYNAMTIDVNPTGLSINNAKTTATLKFTAKDAENEDEEIVPADLNITNVGTTTFLMPNAASYVTVEGLTNTGTVNVERGIVYAEEINQSKILSSINLSKNTKLYLTNPTLPTEGHIVVVAAGQVLDNSDADAPLALTEGLSWIYGSTTNIPADVSNVIVSSALAIDDAVAEKIEDYNLYLRADLTFKNLTAFTTSELVQVEKEILVVGAKYNSTETSWNNATSQREFIVNGQLNVEDGGLLKIGNNMKITATNNDGNIVVTGTVKSDFIE